MRPPRSSRSLRGLLLALAIVLEFGCASVPEREVIATAPGSPAAIAPYSPAVRVGDLLWLSGQIGIDPATGQLVPGGVEAEARRALENLKAVLAAAGASLADVVAVQVFLADITDYAAFNAVYATYFPERPPARAVVQAAALPRGARVEILLTAVRRR